MAHFYFWHTLSALATSDTKGKWICIGHFVMSSVDSGIFVLLLLLKGQFTIAACDAIHERQKASHHSHTRMLLPRLFSFFYFFFCWSPVPPCSTCVGPLAVASHTALRHMYTLELQLCCRFCGIFSSPIEKTCVSALQDYCITADCYAIQCACMCCLCVYTAVIESYCLWVSNYQTETIRMSVSVSCLNTLTQCWPTVTSVYSSYCMWAVQF